MTLQDLGNIGEFVGAIAVVISLIYLAIQIRQNTRTVSASSYQAALDSSLRVNELLADPRLQRLYQQGRRGVAGLNEDELIEFRNLVAHLLSLYESIFLQHQQGLIDDDFFEPRWEYFHWWVCQPGIRTIWEERGRRYFARSYAKRIDELVANPPAPRPTA